MPRRRRVAGPGRCAGCGLRRGNPRPSPQRRAGPARARRRRERREARRGDVSSDDVVRETAVEPVAGTPDGDDVAGIGRVGLDLLAHPADVDRDGTAITMASPHELEQMLAAAEAKPPRAVTRARAAQDRLDAGDDLRWGHRLDYVVVGTEPEAA